MITIEQAESPMNWAGSDWTMVNRAIFANLPGAFESWQTNGYEGLAKDTEVLTKFGLSRIYRDEKSRVVFEFTEENWTWFTLRWA